MRTARLLCLSLLLPSLALLLPGPHRQRQSGSLPPPERRAVAFLAREVPRWSADNRCFSCHNNGDAARALYAADRLAEAVPDGALDATTRWLARPDDWRHNGGDGPFNDPVLARVQFATALAAAVEAGHCRSQAALVRAADLAAAYQRPDGTWPIEAEVVGSPAAYGASLAAALMRRTLLQADPHRYRRAVARIDTWVRRRRVVNVFDAAAVLLALDGAQDAAARRQRQQCLSLIRRGEARAGGWGPYLGAAPEPFDTALVLLALARLHRESGVGSMRRRGRAYLVAAQKEDGSWPETTRPAGAESYAQRLSTTGWATLALLATPPDGFSPHTMSGSVGGSCARPAGAGCGRAPGCSRSGRRSRTARRGPRRAGCRNRSSHPCPPCAC